MGNSNGMNRFEFYFVKLETLLSQASKEKNPALWLYTNNARTTLFMLESLAKLYAGIHNKKRFEKAKDHFKLLEDTFGAIDYYDAFAKEFTTNSSVPIPVTEYMHAQAREKIQRLNDILAEEKWIGDGLVRVQKIRTKLEDADWKEPKEELKSIFDFYKKSISEIKEFMSSVGEAFTEIEAQVHAIRRKLRWLSIYPQSLQGVIQLKENNMSNGTVSKYLTPEIVDSPFNKMPPPGNNTWLLLFEKNYFLALSWMIAELGKLKDNGLRIIAVTEALQQTEGISHAAAMDKAYAIFGSDKQDLEKILARATSICNSFFEEKNLDKLIAGISSNKN